MAKERIDELEKKKQELNEELDAIQHELDDSLERVRTDVTSRLDPKSLIRNYPLPVLGASLVLGYLLGHKKKNSSHTSSSSGYSSTLAAELKRLATKKVINFVGNYVESFLDKKAEEHFPTTDETIVD